MEKVKKRFERISFIYDVVNLIFSFGLDHYSRYMVSKKLRGVVLDQGTGKGELSFYISKNRKVKKVIGLDISESMLRKRIRKNKIFYTLSDVLNMPFKNSVFDFVVSAYLFRNIEDKKKFFKESKRVLKPGGKIFILDMKKPEFPVFLLFYPYIYIFTKFLEIFYPEYGFLRNSILKSSVKELKNYSKNIKNVAVGVFYLMEIEK